MLTRDCRGRRTVLEDTLNCAKERGIVCMTGIAGGKVKNLTSAPRPASCWT